MLFDLRSRGRRRAVQVIYLGLAILIGGGLILFGVGTGSGGGGLLNGLTGNGSGGGQSQAVDQVTKAALKAVRLHPSDPSSWSQLEQAYWDAAHLSSSYNSNTGQYTTSGKKLLAKTTGAWQHYASLTKSPNADVALLAAGAYGQQADYAQEANAWEDVVQADPTTAKGYECLAFSAYAAKQTRVGDLASTKALSLAPKLQKIQLQSALKASKTQPLYAQEC
jgi:hypothetical protein